jgi:hypothetical protein
MVKLTRRYRIVGALAAITAAVLATVVVPAAGQGRWQVANFPPPNGGVVAFTFIGGNPACASYNGRDCLWGQNLNQIRFDRVRPLVCGADHRAKWGSTGYEDRRHWCNLASRVTRFD